MKFDKETIVVIVICIGLLMAWPIITNHFFPTEKSAADSAKVNAATQPAEETVAPVTTSAAEAVNTAKSPSTKPLAEAANSLIKHPDIILENKVVSFTIDPNNGSVAEVLLKQFKNADRKSDITIRDQALSTIGLESWTLIDVKTAPAANAGPQEKANVTRLFKNGAEEIRVTENFELGNSYVIKCAYEIDNIGPAAVKLPSLSVSAGGLPPLKWLAGDKVFNDPHNIDYCISNGKSVASFSPAAKDDKFKLAQTLNQLDWIGSSNKYFAALLVPLGSEFNGGNIVSRTERDVNGEKYFEPSIAGTFKDIELAPGAKKSLVFDYYIGPKEIGLLKSLLPATSLEILHISYWSWFEVIARPLLWLLNWLKDYCGSYGLSIILLTLIVRIIFWPITQKANKSMRKMQKLQPLMQSIREKYKDDSQNMNAKMMELYKKEKVNPLGGCLPLLLQLPVFFALYSTLDAAVELRQVPFLWAYDLSKPDIIGPPILFGIGLHPLVIVMTVLMIIQQKMTPMMGDQMQQKMMMLMPLIMLVMLYNLPSGLTLYWTISNAFSIIQLRYNLHINKREDAMESLKSKPA